MFVFYALVSDQLSVSANARFEYQNWYQDGKNYIRTSLVKSNIKSKSNDRGYD